MQHRYTGQHRHTRQHRCTPYSKALQRTAEEGSSKPQHQEWCRLSRSSENLCSTDDESCQLCRLCWGVALGHERNGS
eukprot:2413311-Pleurochrysis_carterae.AAC.1